MKHCIHALITPRTAVNLFLSRDIVFSGIPSDHLGGRLCRNGLRQVGCREKTAGENEREHIAAPLRSRRVGGYATDDARHQA